MLSPADTPRASSAQIIADAIAELYAQQQVVSRETLVLATGLKMTVIDDHVSRMVDDGKLRRVRAGVFVPVAPMPEPRPVSVTGTSDGMTIVELGDQVLKLWPREVRQLATFLAGHAVQFASIQAGHEIGVLSSEVMTRLKKLETRTPP